MFAFPSSLYRLILFLTKVISYFLLLILLSLSSLSILLLDQEVEDSPCQVLAVVWKISVPHLSSSAVVPGELATTSPINTASGYQPSTKTDNFTIPNHLPSRLVSWGTASVDALFVSRMCEQWDLSAPVLVSSLVCFEYLV